MGLRYIKDGPGDISRIRTRSAVKLASAPDFGSGAKKAAMSNLDLFFLIPELRDRIVGKIIDNVYQISEDIFIIKARPGSVELLLQPGRRIHITNYAIRKPKEPPPFCKALRKHLLDFKISGIEQVGFERIARIDLSKGQEELSLYVELLKRGNMILVKDGVILLAWKYVKMKDRSIMPNAEFKLPPPSGLDLRSVSPEALLSSRKEGVPLHRVLMKAIGINRVYASELALRAGLSPEADCIGLDRSDFERIADAAASMLSERPNPVVVLDRSGRALDATPFKLKFYEGFSAKEYSSFNDALDDFFTESEREREELLLKEAQLKQIERMERILRAQREELERISNMIGPLKEVADAIYARINEIEWIAYSFFSSLDEGKSAEEALRGVRDIPSEIEVLGWDGASKELRLSLKGVPFSIAKGRGPGEAADLLYKRAKELEGRAERLRALIESTEAQIASMEKGFSRRIEGGLELPRKAEKKWYEKFRWFHSSTGKLVLIGRDAASNELLIKRHLDEGDVVFHADIPGAPFVVVKCDGDLDEATKMEAAIAAASYSKAWAEGLGSLDVFWVNPGQVEKRAPSGEYLKRGAFMIRGHRNYVRGVELRLAIGIDPRTMEVLAGPRTAIERRTPYFVEVVPGETPSRKLAEAILGRLIQKMPKASAEGLKRDEVISKIQGLLPYGKGDLARG
jgi:predicted ribosome quality control (RQC) complex YloA/Tae2 family protein